MNPKTLLTTVISGSLCAAVGLSVGYKLRAPDSEEAPPLREQSAPGADHDAELDRLRARVSELEVENAALSVALATAGARREGGEASASTESTPASAGFDFDAFRDGLNDGSLDLPELTPEEIEAALDAEGRPAHLLVAAAQLAGDPELVERYFDEALEKSPDSPAVLASAAAWYLGQDEPPERLDEVLDHLREVDPTNAFGSYLAAARLKAAGEGDRALEMLKEAGTRSQFHSYASTTVDAAEQLYLHSGHPPVLARTASAFGSRRDYLMPLADLGRAFIGDLDGLQGPQRDAQALEILRRTNRLGEQLSLGGRTMIDELIGMSVQARALEREREIRVRMRDDARVEWIDEHLENNERYKEEVRALAGRLPELVAEMSEQEFLVYLDSVMKNGELVAIRAYLARRGGN